ncbi:phosphate ABC transporter permease PstA [Candidatus Pantoea deserta]|uniref:Phosphate transport system permease protein PstA n=1 Tax=Candidatus Pantoea deserta TaxID=1869313 RepID=A0A3N4PC66_9GAMM|nr:phosphate ABC transporter permease PstA [Pantoea deserta]RPE02257.1 phosphate ABC transporter permease PstA [Pantoea deserta]
MRAMRQNDRWRWLTAGAVAVCLLAFTLLIGLLAWQGMRAFWPQRVDLYTLTQPDGQSRALLGETLEHQPRFPAPAAEGDAQPSVSYVHRYLIKTGNRDWDAPDFRVLYTREAIKVSQPEAVLVLQRRSGGNAYGWFVGLREDDEPLTARDPDALLHQRLKQVRGLLHKIDRIRHVELARLNDQLAALDARADQLRQQQQFDTRALSEFEANQAALQRRFAQLSGQLADLQHESLRDVLILSDAQDRQHAIPLAQIVEAWYPNAMNMQQKSLHTLRQIWHFISDSPTESDGGAFPAIFGTVLMVLLMSLIVMPFGVIAAIWLHEYAGRNALTRLVRIAVVNLAGVPSIVYGVFGLGFFVWLAGGTLDQLFFSRALPNPTFGTPGLLWAALTLALLTLPVVIVATEEGLSRIPDSLRHGSLALGATQAETLWQVILPMALPAMLTGLILAVARAAGETAPLMLVGVVKMVPELPVDAVFPWLHLDRKFMHLGFQIYDLAFQSPNVEADRPLVYATALLLVMIILSLNLLAMALRHRLRERYRLMTQ